jgi:hypothetical protein
MFTMPPTPPMLRWHRWLRGASGLLLQPDLAYHLKRMMAGHSRWTALQAKRLAEAGDVAEHPVYEQAGRDLRLGDQLRAIRRSRNLTQKEVAERAGITQPALSRIELGGGAPGVCRGMPSCPWDTCGGGPSHGLVGFLWGSPGLRLAP